MTISSDGRVPVLDSHETRKAATERRNGERRADAPRSLAHRGDRGGLGRTAAQHPTRFGSRVRARAAPRPEPPVWSRPRRACRRERGWGRPRVRLMVVAGHGRYEPSGRRAVAPHGVDVRQRQRADALRLPPGYAEHAQQLLGHPVGGLLDVALRAGRAAAGRGRCRAPAAIVTATSRSSTSKRPASTAAAMSRRARGARPLSALSSRSTLLRRTRLSSGSRRWSRPVSRKLQANTSAGSSMSGGQVVEQLTVAVHHGLDGSLEQLLLGLEVVVEGAHPDVGGLGDLQDRHVRPAFGDERLRSPDESGPGPGLATVQSVGLLRWCVAHDCSSASPSAGCVHPS